MNSIAKTRMTFLCLSLLFLTSCSQVAITGRKQLNLVPDSLMNSMSYQSYTEFLSENQISSDSQQVELVTRVGLRIQKAVEIYCAEYIAPTSSTATNGNSTLYRMMPLMHGQCPAEKSSFIPA